MNQNEIFTVNHKKHGEKIFKALTSHPEEAERIMALQHHVLTGMENPALFALTSIEQITESLKEDYCISISDEEGLVGFGLLVINRDTPRHAFYSLKNWADKKGKSATVDSIFIHERARGCGLQKKIFELFIRWAEETKVPYLHTTISPLNRYSLENALKIGFKVMETKELYEGKLRHILQRDNMP